MSTLKRPHKVVIEVEPNTITAKLVNKDGDALAEHVMQRVSFGWQGTEPVSKIEEAISRVCHGDSTLARHLEDPRDLTDIADELYALRAVNRCPGTCAKQGCEDQCRLEEGHAGYCTCR